MTHDNEKAKITEAAKALVKALETEGGKPYVHFDALAELFERGRLTGGDD